MSPEELRPRRHLEDYEPVDGMKNYKTNDNRLSTLAGTRWPERSVSVSIKEQQPQARETCPAR